MPGISVSALWLLPSAPRRVPGMEASAWGRGCQGFSGCVCVVGGTRERVSAGVGRAGLQQGVAPGKGLQVVDTGASAPWQALEIRASVPQQVPGLGLRPGGVSGLHLGGQGQSFSRGWHPGRGFSRGAPRLQPCGRRRGSGLQLCGFRLPSCGGHQCSGLQPHEGEGAPGVGASTSRLERAGGPPLRNPSLGFTQGGVIHTPTHAHTHTSFPLYHTGMPLLLPGVVSSRLRTRPKTPRAHCMPTLTRQPTANRRRLGLCGLLTNQ